MAKELTVMKIKSGRDQNGKKIRGYAPRCGKALAELLKENKEVKVVALGQSSANSMVKAIAHCQHTLKEENKNLVASDFFFEEVVLSGPEGKDIDSKVVAVLVKLL